MTQITLASDTLDRLSPTEVETYLQGSGKPATAPFSVHGYLVSWGTHYNADQQFCRDPRTKESENRKYSLVYVPRDERPDFNAMSKTDIIAWVYEHFDITYPSSNSKANMVTIAETL